MTKEFLEKYAEVMLKIGLDLKPGDRFSLAFDETALPLARLIVDKAYEMGAEDIDTRFSDDSFSLSFMNKASAEALDYYPEFKLDYGKAKYEASYHRMFVGTANPTLLENVDAEKIAKRAKLMNEKNKPLMKYTMNNLVKWTLAMLPSQVWADHVFPGDSEGLAKLTEGIIKACRLDNDDPVAAWRKHDAELKEHETWLNRMRFDKLHYQGPGTDLIVGLVPGHNWVGGSTKMPKGDTFMANIPTEEIFTMPDKYRVDGTLRATKPLNTRGKVIEGMEFKFEKGKVVEFKAEKNQDVMEKLLETDPNSRYLGEVALVSDDTPISQSGILFMNTLFDENASCHFALGQAYSENLPGSENFDEETMDAHGMNSSMIHVDFMIGGPEMTITGIKADGEEVPVFEKGVWVK